MRVLFNAIQRDVQVSFIAPLRQCRRSVWGNSLRKMIGMDVEKFGRLY